MAMHISVILDSVMSSNPDPLTIDTDEKSREQYPRKWHEYVDWIEAENRLHRSVEFL
jgi:hypothetical protein